MTERTLGFVGLGNMGAPMVRCLARAGHRVIAFDARAELATMLAAEAALNKAVSAASSLQDVGHLSDIVITMLPDSTVVRAVALGTMTSPGLSSTLKPGSVVVDMSSSYPLDTRTLAQALADKKIAVVDAPVSGGVGKAITGTLAIMAGGDGSALDMVEPYLVAMGTVHRTGALGSGHAIKALNNYVSAAGLVAVCEALAIAEKFGLDPSIVNDVFNASTGRNNTTENKAARYLIPRKFNSGFALALMSKDVGMARSLAHDLELGVPELEFVSEYLGNALQLLGKDADHTAVMQAVLSAR